MVLVLVPGVGVVAELGHEADGAELVAVEGDGEGGVVDAHERDAEAGTLGECVCRGFDGGADDGFVERCAGEGAEADGGGGGHEGVAVW